MESISTPMSSEDTNSPTSPDVEYNECYSANVFSEVAGDNFRIRDGIYLMQGGGGPESGLVFSVDGEVYEVRRDWMQPFTMKKIEGNATFVISYEHPELMRQLKEG